MKKLILIILLTQSFLFCQSISFKKTANLPMSNPMVFDLAYAQDTVFMATSNGIVVFIDSTTNPDILYRSVINLNTSESIKVFANDSHLLIWNGDNFFTFERNENILSSYIVSSNTTPSLREIFPFGSNFIFRSYLKNFDLMNVTSSGVSKKYDLTFEDQNTRITQSDFFYPYTLITLELQSNLRLLQFNGVDHFDHLTVLTGIPNVYAFGVYENYLGVYREWGVNPTGPPDSTTVSVYNLNHTYYDLFSHFRYSWFAGDLIISNKFIQLEDDYFPENDDITTLDGLGAGNGQHLTITNNDYYFLMRTFKSHNGIDMNGLIGPAENKFSLNNNFTFRFYEDGIDIQKLEEGAFRNFGKFSDDYDRYLYSKDSSLFVLRDSSVIRGDMVDGEVNEIYSINFGDVRFYRDLGDILAVQKQNYNFELYSYEQNTATKIYETDQIHRPMEIERVGQYIFILDAGKEICKFDINSLTMTLSWLDNNITSKKLIKTESFLIYCGGMKIQLLDPMNDVNPVLDEDRYTTIHDSPIKIINNQNNFYLISQTLPKKAFIVKFNVNNSDIQIDHLYQTEHYEITDAALSGNEIVLQGTENYYWYYDSTATSVKTINEDKIPSNFELHQNYPNPFNPTTKIKFVIPANKAPLLGGAGGGLVTIKVYDLLGKEVATLLNKPMQPGTYEVEFDASNLPSGVYFYRLKSSEFSNTKKMVLLR